MSAQINQGFSAPSKAAKTVFVIGGANRMAERAEFRPDLSPKRMLELGVFGGWYFEGDVSGLPRDWLENARLGSDGFDPGLNCFGVASGQSRAEWKSKGWITPEDPLGWFQWYCRYAMGRRVPAVDRFQIGRWKAFGARHIGAIRANCRPFDLDCRRAQRQALLQWAYDPFF